MTSELVGFLVSMGFGFSAAETLHYMSNEPRQISQFLLPRLSRQKRCDGRADRYRGYT